MRGHKSLRAFLQAHRSGATLEAAASIADMDLAVARLHEQVEKTGGYAEIRVHLKKHGDNGPAASAQLRGFIEQAEAIKEQQEQLAEDLKTVFQTAKSEGFEPKAMRNIIKLRELDPDQRAEHDNIMEIYREAMGID